MNIQKQARALTALLLALMLVFSQGAPLYAAAEQTAVHTTVEAASLTRGQARDTILAAASHYRDGLKTTDIMSGYSDGSLKEGQAVTRIEVLVMISRAFGALPKPGNNLLRAATDAKYSDVPAWADDWFDNLYAGRMLAPETDGSLGGKVTAAELDTLLRRVYALYGTRIEDDFYTTVNNEWLDDSEFGEGTFKKAQADADAQFDAVIKELVSGKWEKGTPERKFADYYETIMRAAADKPGIAALAPYLDAIGAAKNLKEFEAAISKIGSELNFEPILYFYLRDDPEDGRKSAIELYVNVNMNISGEDEDSEAVIQHGAEMEALFKLAGDKNPQVSAKLALEMEYAMTNACYESYVGGADPGDSDRLTPADLQKMLPQANTKVMFANSGFREDSFVMSHLLVEAMPKIAKFYTDEKIEPLKALARFRLINRFKEAIGLGGNDGDDATPETAMKQAADDFTEYANYAYAKKYLSDEARADVSAIAAEIMAYYKERIAAIGFMGDATKQAALAKLNVIRAQIGGPTEPGELIATAEIKNAADGGTALSNAVAIMAAKKVIEGKAQGKPRETDVWPSDESTHLVHAAFIPETNVFVVPAGILCAPFYEYGAPIEKNMAGIGWVMGHEITHAFDVRGAEYDASGQKSDWWTAEDRAAFAALNAAVIDYYDGYEAAPGIAISGEQTLSENTADLGGAAAALSVLKSRKTSPDYKLFFTHSAEVQRITQSREGLVGMSENDDHAPYKVRANRVFSALNEFYDAFGVKPGDGMYVAPEKRVKIW